jgi:Cys-rich protein (TIGR01571 family)
MQAIDAKTLYPEYNAAAPTAFMLNCCLCCVGAAMNRSAVREKLSREGNFLVDCLLELYCCCFAVNQEWREVSQAKYDDASLAIWDSCGKKETHQD